MSGKDKLCLPTRRTRADAVPVRCCGLQLLFWPVLSAFSVRCWAAPGDIWGLACGSVEVSGGNRSWACLEVAADALRVAGRRISGGRGVAEFGDGCSQRRELGNLGIEVGELFGQQVPDV